MVAWPVPMTASSSGNPVSVRSRSFPLGTDLAQGLHHPFRIKGFDQKILGSGAQGLNDHGFLPHGTADDDLGLGSILMISLMAVMPSILGMVMSMVTRSG